MTDAFPKDGPLLPTDGEDAHPSEEMDTLRRIIVGPEHGRVSRLEQRLDDKELRAHEVSRVLPDAIVLSNAKDQRLARVLHPTIEGAIRTSVQKNPKALADAIFPLLGPGIRKAISATILGMIQSFNQLLNHSVSIQGFKWRLEALRTRKPYAEIVLLHTLLYQVEQVFLIHRQSGLVLQHVVGASVKYQDPDLVSGMLTAIEDFVRDSFHVDSEQSLDTLRIGSDRSVWIEQGAKAMLAVVIRGTPPLELRHRMAEILNDIHLKFGPSLNDYDGDATALEGARDDLATCLDSEFKASGKKTSPLLWVVSAVVVVVLVLWSVTAWRQNQRTANVVTALRSQPGIVVTNWHQQDRWLSIFGLKDPLADDPETIAQAHGLSADQIRYHWRPYVSLEPELTILRARRVLQPPPTVTLVLDGDTLVASGEAGHQWIRRFHDVGLTVAGVNHIRKGPLVDSDLQNLHAVRQRVEAVQILFLLRSSSISPDQIPKLKALVDDLHQIEALTKRLGRPFGIRIVGYTDDSGSERANLKLSQERAEAVHRFLIDNGNLTITMMAVGMGAHPPVGPPSGEHLRARSRFAGFELINDAGFRQGSVR